VCLGYRAFTVAAYNHFPQSNIRGRGGHGTPLAAYHIGLIDIVIQAIALPAAAELDKIRSEKALGSSPWMSVLGR
jgi:hypothetical protein